MRASKKFAAIDDMLFTTASGWDMQEVSFNLNGADPLEQFQGASSHSVHEGVSWKLTHAPASSSMSQLNVIDESSVFNTNSR